MLTNKVKIKLNPKLINNVDIDLLDQAIFILRECEPKDGYMGAFSGGKDSVVLHEVAKMAGVNVYWQYNNTTIDPPELVYFIRKYYPHVHWKNPKHGNFFRRMKTAKIIPNRWFRYCCTEFKEDKGPPGCVWITGVRREESHNRSKYKMIDFVKHRIHIRPILNWDAEYLWRFIYI